MNSFRPFLISLMCCVFNSHLWRVHAQDGYGYGSYCYDSKSLMANNNCECNYGHSPEPMNAVAVFSTFTHPEVVTTTSGWTMVRAMQLQHFWFETTDDLHAHQDADSFMPAHGDFKRWQFVGYNLSPWVINDEIYILNDFTYVYMHVVELHKVIRNMRYRERLTGQAVNPQQTYWTTGVGGASNYINSLVVLKAGNIVGDTAVEYNVYLKRGYGIPLQLLIGETYESSKMLYSEGGVQYPSATNPRAVFSRSHEFLPCMQCPMGKFKAVLGATQCDVCQQFSTTLVPAATSQSDCMCDMNYRWAPGNTCVRCNMDLGEYTSEPGRLQQCQQCPPFNVYFDVHYSGEWACLCAAGYSPAPGTGVCTACLPGFWKDTIGSGSCQTCVDEHSTTVVAAIFKWWCTCNAGFVKTSYYADECLPCPVNTYRIFQTYEHGNADWNTCLPCPPYSTTTTTNVALESCECQAGMVLVGGECRNCAAGTYSPVAGRIVCEDCDIGKFTHTAGSNQCRWCLDGTYQATTAGTSCDICQLGKYSAGEQVDSKTVCRDCALDTYSDVMGAAVCKQCTPNSFTSDVASVTAQQCICKQGFSPQNNNCVQCALGTLKILAGQHPCTPCEAGKFSTAREDRMQCQDCPAGKYGENSGQVLENDALSCHTCPDFLYTTQTGQSVCLSCAAGEFSAQRDQECQPCSAGWYSASGSVSPCTACTEGKISANQLATYCDNCGNGKSSAPASAVCTDCLPGTFSNTGGVCRNCGTGKVSAAGESICHLCRDGTEFISSNQPCRNCSAGMFGTMGTCGHCPDGMFSILQAQTSCSICAAGKSFQGVNQACLNCTPGSFSIGGLYSQCLGCPGEYDDVTGVSTAPDSGMSACLWCVPGQWNLARTQIQCMECESGKYSNYIVGVYRCTDCERGKYSLSESQTTCHFCENGTYFTTHKSVCGSCVAGQYLHSAKGANLDCNLCAPGTYSTSDMLGLGVCAPCVRGMFIANSGATACTKCAPGFVATALGSVACTSCPAGKTSNVWATQCSGVNDNPAIGDQTCPENKFLKLFALSTPDNDNVWDDLEACGSLKDGRIGCSALPVSMPGGGKFPGSACALSVYTMSNVLVDQRMRGYQFRGGVVGKNGHILLVPFNADNSFFIFNTSDHTMKETQSAMPPTVPHWTRLLYSGGVYVEQTETIYLSPATTTRIGVLDMTNLSVPTLKELSHELSSDANDITIYTDQVPIRYGAPVLVNDCIFFVPGVVADIGVLRVANDKKTEFTKMYLDPNQLVQWTRGGHPKFGCGIFANNKLFLVPLAAEYIGVVDIPDTSQLASNVNMFTIPVKDNIRAIAQKFSSAILASDDYIYLVPCRARGFMRINTQTNTIHDILGHDTSEIYGSQCAYAAAIQIDHKIYFIPTSRGDVHVIDPQNLNWHGNTIPNAIHGNEGLYSGGVHVPNGLIYMLPLGFRRYNTPSITTICPAVWTQTYMQCALCPPNSVALGPTDWRCECAVQHKPQYLYNCVEEGCGTYINEPWFRRCQACQGTTQYRFMDECESCDNGFQLNAQKNGCDQSPCVTGQFRNVYSKMCEYCPPGYHMSFSGAANEPTQDNCQKCSIGKYMHTR